MRNLYEYIFALISSVRSLALGNKVASGSLKGVILMIRLGTRRLGE